ncbi:hypothetical protein [Paenibacillus sp. YYML68]|uniref:hypothetical protein n=1 Tax=Paenibacillus sp. YYML68 TaxID=2909250 RepID=UPI002490F95F|nr:hypothetical protein [Paenibacillus sp. YYML68]
MQALTEGQPKPDWDHVKSVVLSDAADAPIEAHFFVEKGNVGRAGEAYVYLEHKGRLYELGDVAASYGLDEVAVELLKPPYTSGVNDVRIIAGLGTSFTTWHLIGYDEADGKLLTWQVIGRPRLLDLDGDGLTELVAVFEGVHNNPPDLAIFRSTNEQLEVSNMNSQSGRTGIPYTRLMLENDQPVIQAGDFLTDTSVHYRYVKGILIQLP